MARLEEGLANLTRQISRELDVAQDIHRATQKSIDQLTALAERQDARQDRAERAFSRLMGGLAVLVVIVNFVAPLVVQWVLKQTGVTP